MYNSFEKQNISKINVNKVPVSITVSPPNQSVLIDENIMYRIDKQQGSTV